MDDRERLVEARISDGGDGSVFVTLRFRDGSEETFNPDLGGDFVATRKPDGRWLEELVPGG